MDKTAKNVLATVGAIAVATSVPVLAAGVAIGVAASNPEKTKEAVKNLVGRVEDVFTRATACYEENECECCHGGKCDCDAECCCDCEDEEDIPVAEEEHTTDENAERENTRKEKLERLFQDLLDLAE